MEKPGGMRSMSGMKPMLRAALSVSLFAFLSGVPVLARTVISLDAGWRALVEPFQRRESGPANAVLDRIVVEVWWQRNGQRRTMQIETLRARRPRNPQEQDMYPYG